MFFTLQELVHKNSHLFSKNIPEVDEFNIENMLAFPSTSLVLPPILKENEVVFISFKDSFQNKYTAKSTLHTLELQSKQWKHTGIAPTISCQNQVAFPLLYKGDIAIIRVTMEGRSANYKVGILKLKEMSQWELIPFTSDAIAPVELKNFQCGHSTRYIVLVSIFQYTITFHIHNYKSQSWSSINFPLPTTKISSEIQSCAVAHHTVYCSLMSTERNHQKKVTIYKLKLECITEKGRSQNNPNLEHVYAYDLNVLRCHLFVANGEIMIAKVIAKGGDNKSSTLEFSSLNDTLVNSQKKDYPFVIKLLSVIPLHSTMTHYNRHVLIIYENQSCKTQLEIFCLS